MVFEQFIECKCIRNHKPYLFFLGFIYTFIAYIVSYFFFGSYDISIAVLFSLTILLLPSLQILINMEEKKDRKWLPHFIKEHKDIFEMYLLLSLGIFFAYVIIGSFMSADSMFIFQQDYLNNHQGISETLFDDFLSSEYNPEFENFVALASQNILIVAICFILSLFYGAGAVFLAILNASVFATYIVTIMKYVGKTIPESLGIIGLFMIHLIPELSGFIIAAIAGSVASRALIKEKFMSRKFSNVMKNCTVLLLISICFIIVAALLETFVTSKLVHILF